MLFVKIHVKLSVSFIEFFTVPGNPAREGKEEAVYIPGTHPAPVPPANKSPVPDIRLAVDTIWELRKPPEVQKLPTGSAGLFVIEEGDRNFQYRKRYRCQYNHYSNNQYNNEVTFVAKHIISTP
jgi:hypothetical protein